MVITLPDVMKIEKVYRKSCTTLKCANCIASEVFVGIHFYG
jgi:hypothetical protein